MFKICLIILLAVYVHAQDIAVELGFDPCTLKECAKDEVCRVVEHAQLLEIPVAACVKTNTRPTESEHCTTLEIGSNILNCKTLSDWTLLGHTQCSVEEERTRIRYKLDERSVETKYVCHQKTGEDLRFLSAKFHCCNQDTLLTVAPPPETTTPADSSRPREDGGLISEEGDSSEVELQNSNGVSMPVTEPSGVQDDSTVIEILVNQQGDNDDNKEQNHEITDITITGGDSGEEEQVSSDSDDQDGSESDEDDGLVHSFLFLVAFITAGCVIFSIGLGAYIRFLSKNNSRANKRPPTVFVNQNCDEYNHVFEAGHHKEPLLKNIYF